MTAPNSNKTKRGRGIPEKESILNRPAFLKALDDRGISLKKNQIEGFYQCLHRQHYPPLDKFVENYYRNETKQDIHDPTPLKNMVSKHKNRNRVQLCKQLLQFLKDPNNGFTTITSTVHLAKTSKDNTTTKLAVRLHDGHTVESVLMRYVSRDGSRASLCVSSQVGCAMGCTFCATATMGIRGDLTSGEILEQMVHANRILAKEALQEQQSDENHNNNNNNNNTQPKKHDVVRNVVFMGMGEPLNNYDNVVEACRCLIDRKRWNLGYGKVTVSTVGVTPRIRDLTRDLPEVCLALSLHAPNQESRSKIVPAAKAYKIEGLIDALDNHMMAYLKKRYDGSKYVQYTDEERKHASTRRRAMIEYVMLEGDTSSFECAHQLGKLCENRQLLVNLIPYNQTDVKDKLRCPSDAHMDKFKKIVTSYGTFCTIRRTMGADIASACGQLVVAKEQQEGTIPRVVDIEDVGIGNNNSNNNTQTIATTKTNTFAQRKLSSKKPLTTKVVENNDKDKRGMDTWITPLAIATGISAAAFAVSSLIFISQRRRR